jgi:hypothetical protein
VNQYRLALPSISSIVSASRGSPRSSVHTRYFSANQVASPSGESASANASVYGRVPWIA